MVGLRVLFSLIVGSLPRVAALGPTHGECFVRGEKTDARQTVDRQMLWIGQEPASSSALGAFRGTLARFPIFLSGAYLIKLRAASVKLSNCILCGPLIKVYRTSLVCCTSRYSNRRCTSK